MLGLVLMWGFWPRPLTPPTIPESLYGADPAAYRLVERGVNEVSSNTTDPLAWLRLGFAYEANELDSLALESYLNALDLDGGDPKIWYRLSQVRKRLGDRPAAVEAAKVAVDLAPGYAPLRLRLGLWLLEQGKLTQADHWFAQAAELDRHEPAGTWGRARVMMQRNHPHKAEKILRRLDTELPGHSYTHLLLAAAYRQLGRAVDSAEEFSKGQGAYFSFSDPWNQDLNPYQTGLMHQLRASEQLIESGRLDEARGLLQRLYTQYPDHFSVLNNLGIVYTKIGMTQEAIRMFRRALARHPNNPHLHSNIATTYLVAGNSSMAMKHLDRVVGHPSLDNVPEKRGLALLQARRPLDAAIALERAHAADPDNALVLVQLGVAQCDLRLWKQALDKFERALALDSTLVEAQLGVGTAAMNLGRSQRAQEAFRQASILDPSN